MVNDSGLPVTWTALLIQAREAAEYALQGPLEQFATRAMAKRDSGDASSVLASAGEVIARAAVALGPASLAGPAASLNAAFEKAMASFPRTPSEQGALQPLSMLQYDSTLRCCGYGPSARPPEADWIGGLAKHSKRLDEIQMRTTAFLAIAAGQPAVLPRLIGGSIPADFVPARTFQFNVDGFLRYLASGHAASASADAVTPAWNDFLKAFPHLLGSDVMDWAGLLAAARAVYTRFHGLEIGAVAQRLHEEVAQLP